jgi:hypothetical protein
MPAALALLAAFTVAAPTVKFNTISTARRGFYTTSLKLPVFGGAAWADKVNQDVARNAKKALAGWMKESFPAKSEKPRLEYFYQAAPTVSLATPNLVSFYFTVSTFTAGAHPMTVSDPHTYVNGKEIHSADIFQKGSSYQTVVSNLVIGKLMNNNRAAWVQEGTVKEMTKAQQENFIVTPTALTYLFDPYDMGPYAVGAFQVKLPFSELNAVIDRNGALKSLLK